MTPDQTIADPRTHEILESVKAVFAAKGFDGASMQDLARAAGMSAGNFYRYFPSKDALIEALIERELADTLDRFDEVIKSRTPLMTFRRLAQQRIEAKLECNGPMWREIEAAATRRPEVAALLGRLETRIINGLVAVFARIADVPIAEAERRFTAHARLVLMLVQGLSLHCAADTATGTIDQEVTALVDRIINYILSEVADTTTELSAVPMGAI
jgi:AcrR family transcriptional regulator